MMFEEPLSVADVARLAEALLPKELWDYVAGGSGAETTLAANRSALDAVALLPRVLSGVDTAETATRLVGSDAALPISGSSTHTVNWLPPRPPRRRGCPTS